MYHVTVWPVQRDLPPCLFCCRHVFRHFMVWDVCVWSKLTIIQLFNWLIPLTAGPDYIRVFLIFISTLNTCKETWPFINQQDFKIADLHFVKSGWLRLRLRLQLKQHAVYFSDGYLTTSRYYELYIKNFEIRLLVVFIFKKNRTSTWRINVESNWGE